MLESQLAPLTTVAIALDGAAAASAVLSRASQDDHGRR